MLPVAKLFAGLIGLVFVLALSTPVRAQIIATRIDPNAISNLLVVDGTDGAPKTLKQFEGSITETMPAPSGRLVGALVAERPTNPATAKGRQRVFRLYILNFEGATIRTIDHVRRFAFSPDSAHVAVIRGRGYEGGPGFFPSSTEIFGLQGADIGRIEGLEKATDITWTTFDDDGRVLLARVYEGRTTIVEYILRTRVVIPTQYLGHQFSPDGRFYYLTPAESLQAGVCDAGLLHDSCVRVYARKGWRPLPIQLDPTLRRAIGWADNKHLMLANERNHDCRIVDVDSGNADQQVPAVDWQWSPRPGFVIHRPQSDGNFAKLGKPAIRAVAK